MAFTYGDITNAKGGGGQTITAYQVRLGYELQSQDVENNTSVFKLQLEVRSTNSTYKTYGYNQTTTIDGTALSAKTFDMRSTNVWQVFGTRTITVTHNADGTYSSSKSGSFTTTATSSSSLKSGSASVNVVLPTIPRASSITVSDANIGSGTSIMINKASDSFTTTLRYRALKPDGTYTEWSTIVTKSDFREVYPWTVPTSLYTLIPNNRTIVCEFEATTYSEDTVIGSPTTTTATFTANVYPTINSITAQTIDQKTYNLTGDHDTIIKGVSGLQISVNATAGTGASISSYVIGGETTSSSTKTIVKASSNTYNVSVYDTRGEPPTTQSITMPNSMVEYVPLTINATISRNTPVDGNVNVSFNGNYFNDTFGSQNNSLTVQYRSIEKGSSWENVSWNNLTPTISGNTYTGTTQLNDYDYTKQYEFQIRAIDEIQTKTIEGINVSKGKPIFNWADEYFNVNGEIYQNESKLIEQGTWTPALENATATYDKQIGKYLKIGKLIHIEWQLKGTINTIGSPAYAYISGLPYSSSIETAGNLFEYGGCFNNDSTPRLVRVYANQLAIQNGTTGGVSISSWETGHGTFYLSGSATYIKYES